MALPVHWPSRTNSRISLMHEATHPAKTILVPKQLGRDPEATAKSPLQSRTVAAAVAVWMLLAILPRALRFLALLALPFPQMVHVILTSTALLFTRAARPAK